MLSNIICIWAGAIVDIPAGWALCDGNQGTPNLTDKFLIGAGDTFNPGGTATTNVAEDGGVAYYALAYIMKL